MIDGAARVFAELPYPLARMKHIARESGISEGAIYFHFQTKSDVAAAIVELQQERMVGVMEQVQASPDDAMKKLVGLMTAMANLMTTDTVVQAAIMLASQPGTEIFNQVSAPYFSWIDVAREIITAGVADGSMTEHFDAETGARFVNSLFVGAQVLSGLEDRWRGLPQRIDELLPLIESSLGKTG